MKNVMLHVYTGNGKGKSTAAFGLALRAAGQDFKVKIIQFMKSEKMFNTYGEVISLRKFEGIEVFQYGTDNWVDPKNPQEIDIEMARKGLLHALEIIKNAGADLLILDEILYAYKYKLITKDELLSIVNEKNDITEIVLTGRDAPDFIIEKADLVTEMKEIKHYFKIRNAKKGIEF